MNLRWKKIGGISIGVLSLTLLVFIALTQTQRKYNAIGKGQEIVTADTTDIGLPIGDDPWQELKNLVAAYNNSGGMAFKGNMKLIDDNGENEKVLEEARFEYRVVGDEYYYLLGPVEVVTKKDFVLLADNINKTIALSPIAKHTSKSIPFDIGEFRKLMQEMHAKAVVTQRGNEKVLTIDSFQHGDIQGYRIYYDPVSYKISRMLLGMARPFSLADEDEKSDENKPEETGEDNQSSSDEEGAVFIDEYIYYLELTYESVEKLSLRKGEFKPENKFVRIVGGKTELTAAFKTYNLVNAVAETSPNDNNNDE